MVFLITPEFFSSKTLSIINHSHLFVMDEQVLEMPWREGSWKSLDGGQDVPIIKGDKVIQRRNLQAFATLKFGHFGQADPKIVEMTGERNYNLELTHNSGSVDLGVLFNEGTKLVFKNIAGMIRPFQWVSEEEAEKFAADGDPIEAPPSHYKVQPEVRGRLICITGPPGGHFVNLKNNISNCRPGLGKSTTAQLLSRNHGFVYYECDCFFNGKNPYIPPHVENPSVTQLRQRRLIGEGAEERRKLNEKVGNVFICPWA